jgi:hypothetical protein
MVLQQVVAMSKTCNQIMSKKALVSEVGHGLTAYLRLEACYHSIRWHLEKGR